MSISGIQGQMLEVTVVGCNRLKDTEWISRQDPYVCLEYGSYKFRTRTCTDGGKNPTFQEKFVFTLIEGLRELNVIVWNSNSISSDDFIGSGKIQLQKALSQGFDDSAWPLHSKTGRHAGEVRLILHYSHANKPASSSAPSAPPYMTAPPSQYPVYSTPQPAGYPTSSPYPSYPSYPPKSAEPAYPPPPQLVSAYPPPPQMASAYPPPPQMAYPPPPQLSSYPPQTYPPPPYPPQTYPPPPHASYNYPPPAGPYPGVYPPPPPY